MRSDHKNNEDPNQTPKSTLQRSISLDRFVTEIIEGEIWKKKSKKSSQTSILLALHHQRLQDRINRHKHFPAFLIPKDNSPKAITTSLLRSIAFWSLLNSNTISTQGYSQLKMIVAIESFINFFINKNETKYQDDCLNIIQEICEKYIYAYEFISKEEISIFNKKIKVIIEFIENKISMIDESHIMINESSLTLDDSNNSNCSSRICDLINILHKEKSIAENVKTAQDFCYRAAISGQEASIKIKKVELGKVIQEYLSKIEKLKEGKMSVTARLFWEPLVVELCEKLKNEPTCNKANLTNLTLLFNKNHVYPLNRDQLNDFLVLKPHTITNLCNLQLSSNSSSPIETEYSIEVRKIIYDTLVKKSKSDNQSMLVRQRKLIKLKTKLSNLDAWQTDLKKYQKSLNEIDSEKSLEDLKLSIKVFKLRLNSLQRKCDDPMEYHLKMLAKNKFDKNNQTPKDEKILEESPRISRVK